MLADASQRSLKTETRVFDQASQQADGEVKRIIAANLGRAVKAPVVPTASADPEAVASAPRGGPARFAHRRRRRLSHAHADPFRPSPMATSSASAASPAAPPRTCTAAASRVPAAEGQRARARHDRAVAGDVHERARQLDRERVDPGDLRRHGRQPDAGHLGHHVVRGRQRDLGAADRLAHAALRPGATLHRQHPAVRDRVVAVRPRAEHRNR